MASKKTKKVQEAPEPDLNDDDLDISEDEEGKVKMLMLSFYEISSK